MKFKKCLRKLMAMMPVFRHLRAELELIQSQLQSQDSLKVLVRFFNVVSPWYDHGLKDVIAAFNGVKNGQSNGVLNNLKALAIHFVTAGRSDHRMNRTKAGETVTPDKVFVGDTKNGILTQSVTFWWGNPRAVGYGQVCQQAKDFLTSHTEAMIKIINALEAEAIKI